MTGSVRGLGDSIRQEQDRPFEIVEFGPKGQADAASELHVVFSRPLRALELAETAALPPIAITPAIDGQWQWLGTQALSFVPRGGRLPGAQRYSVSVPATARALDGTALGKRLDFEFVTPAPALVLSVPENGAKGLGPATTIELSFNQPIAPEALARALRLRRVGNPPTFLDVSVGRPDPKDPRRLRVLPSRPLPVHSEFELAILAGLQSEEGPVASSKERVVRFETYGPLRAKVAGCDRDSPHGRCYAPSGIGLELSNPVPFAALKRAVSGLEAKWPTYYEDQTAVTYVTLENRFLPGSRATLEFGAGLRDIYGQTLGRVHRETVEFDDVWPDLEIGVSGRVLQPSAADRLSIGSVNVSTYQLGHMPLSIEQAARFESFASDDERWAWLAGQRQQRLRERTITPTSAKNGLYKAWLDPKAALGAPGRGPLLVTADAGLARGRAGHRGPLRELRRIHVTDLAITAKVSRYGSVVWVTRLSDARPVPGAEVELVMLDGPGPKRTYRTNALGVAEIPAADFSPELDAQKDRTLIAVRSGDDWTYQMCDDFLPPWRMSVPTDFSGHTGYEAMLLSERGIYRPGDTVQVKGIVRRQTPTGSAVPVRTQFAVRLVSPEGVAARTRKVLTNEFGSFSFPFRVPSSARLGLWRAELKGVGQSEISTSFEVAEFRPAEAAVTVEAAHRQWVRGEQARFFVHGSYLHGAPMAGTPATYRVTRSVASFTPPNGAGYVFDASQYHADLDQEPLASGVLLEGSGKLDAQGNLPVSVKLDLPAQRGTERVTLDTEVTDVSRQSQSGSASALVHPAAFYVGLDQPENSFVDAPGQFSPRVVALGPDGQRVTGREVKLELVRRRWTLVREQTAGGLHSVTRAVDETVDSCRVLTAPAATGCALRVSQAGYHLVRAIARDAQGRETQACSSRYAIGSGEAFWRDSDDRTVKLTLDRKAYSVGQTARLLVQSPFREVEALVTVERAGVYVKHRRVLRGPTPTLEIPVQSSFRPNAFVSVHLIRGGKQRADARGSPNDPTYRYGYVELRVDPEEQRLRVRVEPSAGELEPGQKVTVNLAVADRHARPERAELTVFAVDEGVLALTGYRTPDPLPVFTATRRLAVATLESRDSLARVSLERIRGALGLAKGREAGGGGGEGLSSVRRDFRPSAYYNASVVTDPNGRASVSFQLPSALTTYRVMALGVTADDHYGFGEAKVVASKRLMARPALPRFFRVGDRARASVIVSSKRLPRGVVHARLTANGIRVLDGSERAVTVPADGSVEVPFSVRAERIGSARLRFDVSGQGQRDSVELTLPVRAPIQLEHVAFHGSTRTAVGERLGDLRSARPDVGELTLSVASTALVGVGSGMQQLIEYPFGCTEQVVSRLLPLLPLRELARSFSVRLPQNLDQTVDQTVADIIRRQQHDGGFALWPESITSSPWVSAYALFVLSEAKQRGAEVPQRVLEDGKGYLRRLLERRETTPVDLASRAFLVDVLAELGAPDPGYVERLFDRRSELPLFARALLLHTFARNGTASAAKRQLMSEIASSVHLDGKLARAVENRGNDYAALMDSPTRTSALVLHALLAAEPKHALAEPLARGLLADRRHGVWRSTQEAAFALLALDAFRRLREPKVPGFDARVWLDQRELMARALRPGDAKAQTVSVPMVTLMAHPNGTLVFEQKGRGTVYYDARLTYAPSRPPTRSLDQGFFVHKTLRTVTPSELDEPIVPAPERDTRLFNAQDLVLADIVVVTGSPRRFVVIDDPMPAGFEAVDARLATTAAWLKSPLDAPPSDGIGREQPPELTNAGAASATELRDDRVLFFVDEMPTGMKRYRYLARATSLGRFVVPPTKVEQMYVPETFGRTAAGVVEVR